jgi:hypothetical protein
MVTLSRPAVKTSTWWNEINFAGHRDAGGAGA